MGNGNAGDAGCARLDLTILLQACYLSFDSYLASFQGIQGLLLLLLSACTRKGETSIRHQDRPGMLSFS